MAAPLPPPFALSRFFVQPAQECRPIPADVVERAHEIVDQEIEANTRQRNEAGYPVPWQTLARILAFDARKVQARYREAYLDDEAIARFLQAICREVNRQAQQQLLAAPVIDLDACSVRAVAFDPVTWSGPANRLVRNEMTTIEMGEVFTRHLGRKGVQRKADILGLDYIFFPRCRGYHWTLSVIWPKLKRFATLNSAPDELPYTAFVEHFVRPFLQGVLGDLYNATEWVDASDTNQPAESSLQRNPTDCGAALCVCAVAIATGQKPSCGDLKSMRVLREAIAGTLVLYDFAPGLWEL